MRGRGAGASDGGRDVSGNERELPFTALSWGGGQQSTAILVASTLGLTISGYAFPRLDLAVFANTGSESQDTYTAIERVAEWARKRGADVRIIEGSHIRRGKTLGLPSLGDLTVARVTGDPRLDGKTTPQLPAFTKNPGGTRGRLNKDCTWDLKSVPIDQAVRRAAKDAGKRNTVTQLIGFGIEEVHRMRSNPHAKEGWTTAFPLIRAKMNRGATQTLCQEHLGFVPPPSACVFCPFRGVAGWRELRDHHPEDWSEVLRVDAAIRDSSRAGIEHPVYLSDQLVPVGKAIERDDKQLTLFGGECDDGGCWT